MNNINPTAKKPTLEEKELKSARANFLKYGADNSKFFRYFGFIIVFCVIILLFLSFLILPKTSIIELSPQAWSAIWIIGTILVLLIIALVLTEIILLIRARARKQAGSKLQSRMVAMFAFVAAVPAVIVAIIAAIVLNQGLDQWFSERMRSMVESSRLVARAYLLEHAQVLRDDIIWVAAELERATDSFATDKEKFQRILTALATTRSLPFTSLVSKDGDVLMRAQISVPGKPPQLPDGVIEEVEKNVPTFIAPGSTNLVGAVMQLNNYDDVYLFVARPVDAEVLEYMRLTDQNITEYRQYDSSRLVFQVTFTIIYIGVALIMLLVAVWIGIAFANRFIEPVRELMLASDKVSKGNLNVQIKETKQQGELNDLIKQFNLMTRQLKEQRQELILANEINEQRRQFTEAVLEGVSAGIIGLNPNEIITLVNSRACEIFSIEEANLVGKQLSKIVPQLALFFAKASSSMSSQYQDQIQLGTEQEGRIYQVRLTREGTKSQSKGYVITLDDLTDLMQAQKTSAWADVARRIAHEIKNPLTPIQLSAERLRRRYGKKLADDFEIFDKCVTTIIRQVGNIGRMIDEFSSFARMPKAVMQRADLSDTIRQAVFLESVRQPGIKIVAKLPKEPNFVEYDERLISQCLTNIIKNSVEAIEIAGIDKIKDPTIIIETRNFTNFVEISISDNGKGWPKENQRKLLEPYVTTRKKGTGLGLAIVAKIVEQHGGEMVLQDAKADKNGRVGACVIIRLPLEHSSSRIDLEIRNENSLDEKNREAQFDALKN